MTIREICERHNINQSDLARRFGIPLRTVQGWYLGERKPPEYVARMIEELLVAQETKQCLIAELRESRQYQTKREPLNILEAQALMEAGMTGVEVAEKMGVPVDTLYRRLKSIR